MTTITADALVPNQIRPRPEPAVISAAQRRRLDQNARALGRLMERRPELRGAYAPADLTLEALITGI